MISRWFPGRPMQLRVQVILISDINVTVDRSVLDSSRYFLCFLVGRFFRFRGRSRH